MLVLTRNLLLYFISPHSTLQRAGFFTENGPFMTNDNSLPPNAAPSQVPTLFHRETGWYAGGFHFTISPFSFFLPFLSARELAGVFKWSVQIVCGMLMCTHMFLSCHPSIHPCTSL